VISEEEDFWSRYGEVTTGVPARGNLVPDARPAALLLQHGVVTVHTHDRDFRKFEFLDVRDPLV
jgi:predicted nucleic acid-binding protein